MLELALYVFLFELIDKWITSNLRKQLSVESSSKKRIKIRKKVQRNRKIQLVFFILLLIAIEIFLIYDAITQPYNSLTTKNCILFPVFCVIYFIVFKKWKRISGNISTTDLDSFKIDQTDYSLYLRGFDNDNYNKIDKLEDNRKEKYDIFSEYWFFKLLKKRYNQLVVSVGMTRELDSPNGTIRLYLDDEDWKDGVSRLMDGAERIFILINDRESCIWEIIQSRNCLTKTIFIADNQTKYDSARNKVKGIITLPYVIIPEGECVSITFENDNPTIKFFKNSRMGYASLIGTKYVERKKKFKWYKWGCLIPIGAIFLLIMGIVIYDTVKSPKKDKQDIEEIIAVEEDPFDKIEDIVNQLSYPFDYGNGMILNSIEIDKSHELLNYNILVNTDSIDMDLLDEYAKSNFIETIKQGDINSQELQFWLFCMQNDISIVYKYESQNDIHQSVVVSLTKEELEEAFLSRK